MKGAMTGGFAPKARKILEEQRKEDNLTHEKKKSKLCHQIYQHLKISKRKG